MSQTPRLATFRIIDASSNRASEGLRTLEEYARFVLEDRHLSEVAKNLRHDLRDSISVLTAQDRLIARAVISDCGTTIETNSEMSRPEITSVVHAAAARVQEALRCIEEYGKLLGELDCRRIQSLRYRSYTLASALCLAEGRTAILKNATLYLIITADGEEIAFSERVKQMFAAGVDLIQLRDKQADDRTLYRYSKIASDIARRMEKFFIVNDRADIAAASGASGVHLGQDELPLEAARRIVGPDQLIGISTHNIEQARQAVLDGADYIGCGPTFPSRTKSFNAFTGLNFLRQVADEISLPSYAIGGISSENAFDVMQTGIHGVAVSSAILDASDSLGMVATFCNVIRPER